MPYATYTVRRNLREIRRKLRAQKNPPPARPPDPEAPPEIFRCPWCLKDPLYIAYHDNEWGRFCNDNQRLFEYLTLEISQAGLSWLTVLKKRENYRELYAGFDPVKLAAFTEADIDRLTEDPRIIRSRRKIKAAVVNAEKFLEVVREHGSFADYIISFFPLRKPIVNSVNRLLEVPSSTPLSERIAEDMCRRGFRYIGPVTCHAFLQAAGFINDHLNRCAFKKV